jgi:hypothetical protein
VGQLSDRAEGGDWTELEQGFFAAAPPEVAVQPPPPPTFDDLGPVEPVRPRRRASSTRLSAGAPSRRPVTRTLSSLGRLARRALAAAGPLGERAWAWSAERARRGARRLTSATHRLPAIGPHLAPSARAAFQRLERGLRPLLSRLASDLPERPDGKTIAGAIAALVVVFGVSASVLGSRSNPRLAVAPVVEHAPMAPSAPIANLEPPAAAPSPTVAPEPTVAPDPASAAAPESPKASRTHVVAKPHRPKHRAVAAGTLLHVHAPKSR